MILDTLEQSGKYLALLPNLGEAFRWLEIQASRSTLGRHQVCEGVIAISDMYQTAPELEKKWETHRNHADLQVVLSGSELVGWAPASQLTTLIPYNPEKDAEFYAQPVSQAARFRLSSGLFAIFFPEDGHQPGVMDGRVGEVRKIVFKIRL